MHRVRNDRFWLTILLVVGFGWAAWEVIDTPISSGTAYPAYSSLRSDPRGAKALFESLSRLPELTVLRSFKASQHVSGEATLLMLGLEPDGLASWTPDALENYEHTLAKGGRLVMGFLPTASGTRSDRKPATKDSKSGIEERWDFRIRFSSDNIEGNKDPHATALYFEVEPVWTVLREGRNGPVIVERPLGGGSIVLVSDSFPFSNQSLSEHAETELLSRILGNSHRIEFDEQHLGIVESGSVATLGRKYHMELPLAVVLIAATLYIWRCSAAFLPPRKKMPPGALEGRDSQAGLTALLRRNVPESNLIDACIGEWRRTARAGATEKLVGFDASVGDAAVTYSAVRRILRGKRD